MTALLRASAILSIVLFTTTANAGPPARIGLGQDADDAFEALEDNFTLRFFDAVTGKPIPGAKVTFEGEARRTNGEGAVTFSEPEDLGDDDVRLALFEHPKYVRAKAKVHFMVGNIFFNRYSISPTLPPGRIRVVLDWTDKPADLDAHLVKKGVYHLSYREKKNHKDIAWLDRDDQDGFGPETVTVLKLGRNAHYSYAVHDYTNQANKASRKLAASRAHVRVYTSQGILQTFVVPSDGKGTVWKVFDVVKGQIRPINTIGNRL